MFCLIFQKPGADKLQGEYAKNIGELNTSNTLNTLNIIFILGA